MAITGANSTSGGPAGSGVMGGLLDFYNNYTPTGLAISKGPGLFKNNETDNEQKTRQMLMDYYNNVQGRQPLQLGATQYGQTSQGIRGQQQSLADQLKAISTGQGPSVAEQQLRQATDRNVAQQASFANSGRGGAMAGMRAANNSARLGAQAAQDAGVMRAQEANQARQLLGLNLHGMREQDEGMSRFNAGQGNEMSQAQLMSLLKQRGMDDDATLRAIAGLQGQNSELANRPTTGERLLSGGAKAFSMYATGGKGAY